MEVKFKSGKSNGFNTYTAEINGKVAKITNYWTDGDHSIWNHFELHIAGLPYKKGGYGYRTLAAAKEAAIKLAGITA